MDMNHPTNSPNVLFIMTDQQRWDCLSAADGGWGYTPNIDRLVNEGVYFTQCYCSAPSCVPSRASLFNLEWPNQLGTLKNGDRWGERSWVELFQNAGYRTLSVGKMHTQPFDASCGFEQRFIVENKDRTFLPRYYDDWDKHLKQRGIKAPNRLSYLTHPQYQTALGAYDWELPKELHWDYFVSDAAKWLLEEHDDRPLFMQLGFPGPHTPYDPPPEYLGLVDEDKIPLPVERLGDDDIPPHSVYRRIMVEGNHAGVKWHEGIARDRTHPDGGKWIDAPSDEQLLRMRKYYAANMAMIDERIGAVLEAFRAKGLLDNTIVVFTSDHGDTLGDHGQIQKWTMYDSVVRIPAVVWAPGRIDGGVRCDKLIQQMDLIPMMFSLAGLPLENKGKAISALDVLEGNVPERDAVFAEHGRCNMLPDIEEMVMVRTREWKLVSYPGREYGELYHLLADAHELENLWAHESYRGIKASLLSQIATFRNDS